MDRQTARSGGKAAGEPPPAARHAGVRATLKRISRSLAAGLVVIVSVLPSSRASAAENVFDVLGPELLGSSVGRLVEAPEFLCRQDDKNPDIQRCTSAPNAPWTLDGIGASAVEVLVKDGRLLQIAVYFREARFTQVLAALSTRLGDGDDWSLTIRSGMAGQLPDQIRIWETDRFALVAQQYDHKIDRASVIYGSADGMAPLLRKIRSTPRGALRDL